MNTIELLLERADDLLACEEWTGEDLFIACREVYSLFAAIGAEHKEDPIGIFRIVDSEVDNWPVGVDHFLLEEGYRKRCHQEMAEYARIVWPQIRQGCKKIVRVYSAANFDH